MTYEQKYKIAKAALDKLQGAFENLTNGHAKIRDSYWLQYKRLNEKIEYQQKKCDELEREAQIWFEKYQYELDKTWWQKLKESIFRPAK